MSKRKETSVAPEPLEEYVRPFDSLFEKWNQREGFRRYLEGLLLPSERNKQLSGLVNTEPVVGAQDRQAQFLQWFLSESDWDERTVQNQRLQMLLSDPLTAPSEQGMLVIDEHGDRKSGTHIAHVGRQYLGNLGKVDNGVVSVTSLWADEGVYYPVDFEPSTPADHFEKGEKDPGFRTKLTIARELVNRAVQAAIPFWAIVADNWDARRQKRSEPSTRPMCWLSNHLMIGGTRSEHRDRWVRWHKQPTGRVQISQANGSKSRGPFGMDPSKPGGRRRVQAGPYGPDKTERAVIATTDPVTLPDISTWYLVTNLPAPGSLAAEQSTLVAASLEEVIRLYGLRMWIEQSYKQVRGALGWSQYQVRSDRAIRRHWQLVCCAFSFCWYHHSHSLTDQIRLPESCWCQTASQQEQPPEAISGVGEKNERLRARAAASLLASRAARGESLVGTMGHAAALLACLVHTAPASSTSAVT